MRLFAAFLIMLVTIFPRATQAAPTNTLGRILLDVENAGEAWYVSPVTQSRYYLGRPDAAFEIMRSQGLGISEKDFAQFQSDRSMRSRLAGRILLQVEKHGEAWYVNPVDVEAHYLGRPDDAFRIMSSLGLGITTKDLTTIAIAGSTTTSVTNGVPFTAQAPFGGWNDARQQEGCEEASVLMAMKWVTGEQLTLEEAEQEILAMSDWENHEFGYFQDTSAHDTAVRLFNRWYDYDHVFVAYDISSADILYELEQGRLVLITIDGTKINHGYYVPPGPERHMMVVHGYDASTGEFLSHDPGTRFGANHRMTAEEMDYMLRDYVSGVYEPITSSRTAMIVVRK